MREDDAPCIVQIEKKTVVAPWSEQIFRDCVRVGYGCWVFEENKRIIGYGMIAVDAGEAHVLNVTITPERQRRGLGLRMMRYLIRKAKEFGADTMFLEVRVSNHAAIDMYRKLKFSEVGTRKGYYPAENDEREDALVLALSLV